MESLGVLLLHPMNAFLEQELDRRCRLWDSLPDSRADFLRAHAASICAVVGNASYGADAVLIDVLPSLEIIASFSVGVDCVDLARCREQGICVTSTPTSSPTTSPTSPSASPSTRSAGSGRPTATSAPASGRPRATTPSPLGQGDAVVCP